MSRYYYTIITFSGVVLWIVILYSSGSKAARYSWKCSIRRTTFASSLNQCSASRNLVAANRPFSFSLFRNPLFSSVQMSTSYRYNVCVKTVFRKKYFPVVESTDVYFRRRQTMLLCRDLVLSQPHAPGFSFVTYRSMIGGKRRRSNYYYRQS